MSAAHRAEGVTDGGSDVVTAILVMLLSTLFLSVMQALVRYIGDDMSAIQVTFLRSIFGLIFILPFLVGKGRAGLVTHRPGLHALRGVLIAVSTVTFFWGLARVPLAEATVLSLVGIIFGSVGAVIFLGEPMRWRRWLAVGVSFLGTLVILRPGLIEPSLGAYAVLLSSITWGLALVVVKELSRTDSSLSIIAWSLILMTVFSFVMTIPVWRWPSLEEWFVGALIGATATAGHFAMTKSLQLADATIVLPLNFTRLIWAALIGYVWFAEVPDVWTWVGSILIAGSVTYISRREAALRRQAVAARTAHDPAPRPAP